MSSEQRSAPVNRTDVDAWLAELQRRLPQAQSAWRSVRAAGGEEAVERHARRLRQDPQYAAAIERLVEAAEQWTGDVAEFVARHPVLQEVPEPMRPKKSWSSRIGRYLFSHWVHDFGRAARELERARDATATLRALTGASDDDSAFDVASSTTPILDWPDFEAAVFSVAPGVDGLVAPPRDGGVILNHVVDAIDASRAHVGRAVVEAKKTRPGGHTARGCIQRLTLGGGEGTISEAEPEVRKALATLGFPPAGDSQELAEQVRTALLAHPENLERYLAQVRRSAEELMHLTGAATIQEALRKAKALLKANTSYQERPRTGVVVYSGGLPGLGKRR